MKQVLIKEKYYWGLFEISLFIKTLNAIADLFGGLVIWFTNKIILVTFILNLLQHELSDDPKDYVAKFIVDSAEALAVNSQYFLGGYLLIHGVIKIFLLFCLYKKQIWAYPVSMIIFSILIFYEFYLFYFSHSLWTFSFILLDIILVWLTWREYGILKNKLIKNI